MPTEISPGHGRLTSATVWVSGIRKARSEPVGRDSDSGKGWPIVTWHPLLVNIAMVLALPVGLMVVLVLLSIPPYRRRS